MGCYRRPRSRFSHILQWGPHFLSWLNCQSWVFIHIKSNIFFINIWQSILSGLFFLVYSQYSNNVQTGISEVLIILFPTTVMIVMCIMLLLVGALYQALPHIAILLKSFPLLDKSLNFNVFSNMVFKQLQIHLRFNQASYATTSALSLINCFIFVMGSPWV